MAFGGPDYEQRIAKLALPIRNTNANQSVSAYSFGGDIAAGATGVIDVPVPASGKEQIFDSLVISADNADGFHEVVLTKISDGAIYFWTYWQLNLLAKLETMDIPNGQQARISVTNNDSATRTIVGVINYIEVPEE